MSDCAAAAQWQIELSLAVRDLLTTAVCIDIENWRQAREHLVRSQELCEKLIKAIDQRTEITQSKQAQMVR